MRVIEKKRPPFMTGQRWAMVVVAFILLLCTLLFMFYRTIQEPVWSEEREARQQAVAEAGLQEISEIYKHVWDTVSWVVKGIDENGSEVYVWMAQDNEPYVSDALDAFSPEKLRSQLIAAKPNAKIMHIRPGIYSGSQCWEVFYKYTDTSEHYYYDFYTFDSGELIVTYKLPAKTEP